MIGDNGDTIKSPNHLKWVNYKGIYIPYSIEYIIRPFRTFFQSLFNVVFVPP